MPTKPSSAHNGASVMSSQASYRYLATFRDQHMLNAKPWAKDGRPWWGWREMAANRGHVDGFCSPLWPGDHEASHLGQWNAPWMPDPIWFDYDWAKGRIRVRYDRMISHFDQMGSIYYRLVNKLCAKNAWPEVERGDIPRDSLTDVFGDPPLSSRIFKAAQASHPWILGFSEEPDEELAKMLGISVPGAGIYNTPRKEGLLPVEKVHSLTDEQLDAKIARAVEHALHIQGAKKQTHSEKIREGRDKAREKREAMARSLQPENV